MEGVWEVCPNSSNNVQIALQGQINGPLIQHPLSSHDQPNGPQKFLK